MTNERACANAPGFSRRNLLAALPASGIGLAFPQLSEATPADPIVRIYREWLAARHEWRALADLPGNGNWDDPRSVAAANREEVAAEKMLATAPTSLAGIGAIAAVLWNEVAPGCTDPNEFDFRVGDLECQAVLAIWRACTGQKGYPDV